MPGSPMSAYRQASKRFGPNPERLIDFRNCFGMIWSVSMLTRSSGATTPLRTVNFSIASAPRPDVDEVPRYRCGRRHLRAHEVGAPAGTLAALEVAVGGRRAALAGGELVVVHREAHRAAGLAPLEPRVAEDAIEAFALGLLLHPAGAWHDHRQLDVGRHPAP